MSCDMHDEMRNEISKLESVAIPAWVRAVLVTAIGCLFVWQASGWVYNQTTFATKTEMKERVGDLKEYMRDRFDRIEGKLDKNG